VFHSQQKLTPKVEVVKLNVNVNVQVFLPSIGVMPSSQPTISETFLQLQIMIKLLMSCGLALCLMSVIYVYLAASAMSC
jgi:hypothetical protein